MSIRDRIIAHLEGLGIPFERLAHPAVTGCDDSLAHRTAAGWRGASSKCILFHAKGNFYLVVTTADREIKARLFKKPFGTKNIRFSTPEEVMEKTGCTVGSMPPFGFENPAVPIFLDGRILSAGHFMFNPAEPTESLRITTRDLIPVLDNVTR
ncbi:MAG: aminoacyl-tRNA deacylase [Leptospirillia bacterium]